MGSELESVNLVKHQKKVSFCTKCNIQVVATFILHLFDRYELNGKLDCIETILLTQFERKQNLFVCLNRLYFRFIQLSFSTITHFGWRPLNVNAGRILQ